MTNKYMAIPMEKSLILFAKAFSSSSYFKLPGKRSGGGEVVSDETLRPQLMTLLPCIFTCVRYSHVAVRLSASRCITSMKKSMTFNIMGSIIENIIPMLGDMASVNARQGAGMLISLLVQGLGTDLVPYARLLVVPLLRCMSDCDHSVRRSVTHSFAALVPLLPLARGVSPSPGLSECLLSRRLPERLEKEVHDLLPPSISNGIRVITSPYGADSAWYEAKLLSNSINWYPTWEKEKESNNSGIVTPRKGEWKLSFITESYHGNLQQ
ncbi:unnamed protein product [Lactuca virosa]|uniref:Proteasome adapter and scaffold protein ECM29 HEAT-repeat domain-containing protein n=1 Tax=Lactuca virosa TaxID=75947 RepID=A0AAU9MSU6_9ASTR|nr:unnamed protein product [Lactuca virosa]